MWRSTCVPKTIHSHSDELISARRRTFHELNSTLSLVRLMKSSTFGLGKRWETFWAASLVIFRKLSSITEFFLRATLCFGKFFLRSWHTLISLVTYTHLTLRKIHFVVLRHLYMDSQCQANYQWRIQGRGPPRPTPPLPTPLFLDQPDARKAETIFFDRWRTSKITDDDWERGCLKFKLVYKFPSGEQRGSI